MTKPRTTIPNYRIHSTSAEIGWLTVTCEDAAFTEHPEMGTCVEATVRLGRITGRYKIYLTIEQALEADIIERAEKE